MCGLHKWRSEGSPGSLGTEVTDVCDLHVGTGKQPVSTRGAASSVNYSVLHCGLKTAESSGLRLALGISGQKTLNLLPNSWSAYQGLSSAHGDAFSCLSYHVCPCVPQ